MSSILGQEGRLRMYHLEFSRAFALFFVHPPTVLLEQFGVGLIRFSACEKDNESSCYMARAKLHRGTGERLSSCQRVLRPGWNRGVNGVPDTGGNSPLWYGVSGLEAVELCAGYLHLPPSG